MNWMKLHRKLLLIGALSAFPLVAAAQDNAFRLAAPPQLVEGGFLQYLLPRFSLKTGVRVTPVAPDDPAEARLGDSGTPVFQGAGTLWHLSHDDTEQTRRFADWLTSDIGQRTIAGFAPDGTAMFSAAIETEQAEAPRPVSGDAALGEDLSLRLCGRCHVVNHKNRMGGMGATPSFALLRGFRQWQDRFASFYALNPHPAFTQVADITAPFDISLPSPIAVLELTAEDIEAIIAYVATLEAADLGAPLQSQ